MILVSYYLSHVNIQLDLSRITQNSISGALCHHPKYFSRDKKLELKDGYGENL